MAILDSTVDRDGEVHVNHHEVLEADYKGNTPDKENFNCPSMHSIEFIIRHKEYFKVWHTRPIITTLSILLSIART